MKILHILIALFPMLVIQVNTAVSQSFVPNSCASDALHEKLLMEDKNYAKTHASYEESMLQSYDIPISSRSLQHYTLPVVVHIIHQGGDENISDAQVVQGLEDLNEAYANMGYYDQNKGVETGFQFCLASRAPDGTATNGINRILSPLTDMDASVDDISLKNLSRWDPTQYINIWLVREICRIGGCGVVGYAYFPSQHGSARDGLVIEAAFFGSDKPSSAVQVHEMGHYLGLYHTFQGGCENTNCLTDGDKVCDTPPDQSIYPVNCGDDFNSCHSDTDSGFATDENDMYWNYMDYGDFDCYSAFTEGQRVRMIYTMETIRGSLLESKACISPCNTEITADFSLQKDTFLLGETGVFQNLSDGQADQFVWEVNGNEVSNDVILQYTFTNIGNQVITLKVFNADQSCYDFKSKKIVVICSADGDILVDNTVVLSGESLLFTSSATEVDHYEWYVDDVLESTQPQLNYQFTSEGIHTIKVFTKNNEWDCESVAQIMISVTCPIEASFISEELFPEVNTPVHFTNQSINGIEFNWTVDNVFISNVKDFEYIFENVGEYQVCLKAQDGYCTSEFCMQIFVLDSTLVDCEDTSIKVFGKPESSELAFDFSFLDNGNILVSGGYERESLLMFIDSKLNIVKSNVYNFIDGDENIIKIYEDSHGFLIISGVETNYSNGRKAFILKYDLDNDQVIWIKRINNTNHGYPAFQTIVELNSGNYICGGKTDIPISKASVIEINGQDGSIIWQKTFDYGAWASVCKILYHDDAYYVAGRIQINSASTDKYRTVLTKLDQNGNEIWTKNHVFPSAGSSRIIVNDMINENGILMVCRGAETGGNIESSKMQLIKTDYNGNLLFAKSYFANGTSLNTPYKIQSLPDGYLILGTFKYDGVNKKLFLLRTDKQGALLWSKSYNLAEDVEARQLFIRNGSTIIIGTLSNSGRKDIFLLKTDLNGNLPDDCSDLAQNLDISVQNLNNYTENLDLSQIGNTIYFQETNYGVSTIEIDETILCEKICVDSCEWVPDASISIERTNCNKEWLEVIVTICNQGNSDIPKNMPLSFYDANPVTSHANLISTFFTDQIIPVDECMKFSFSISNLEAELIFAFVNDLGNLTTPFSPQAHLPNSGILECEWSNNLDYIWFENIIGPNLDLGADTVMCNSSISTLDAGPYFESYTWHDGSSLPIFTAWETGKYWVEVMDYCGNIQSDTIEIFLDSIPDIDLGENITICKTDTITFNPTGFEDYSWATNGTIVCQNCQDFTFQPDSNVTLSVIATTEHGCFAFDTLDIILTKSETVQLPEDTVLCKDGTILLNAGDNFISYKWQDGSTEFYFLATEPGNYWVNALDVCGNWSSDTIFIELDADNVVNLGPDINLCPGDSLVLNLPGFENYYWSSEAQLSCENCESITVFPEFDTEVMMSAENTTGCLVSDTLNITIYSPGKLELPDDQFICDNELVLLNATSQYQSYLWQDGSTDSVYMAVGPGEYCVQVLDQCSNSQSDTVHLLLDPLTELDLGEDIELCQGDSVSLELHGYLENEWKWDNILNCMNCESITFVPSLSTYLSFYGTTLRGCLVSDSIWINVNTPLTFALPADTSIYLGESIKIVPSGLTLSDSYHYNWVPHDGLSCSNCFSPEANPIKNTTYQLQLIDQNGCVSSDEIIIRILKKTNIFVPNVFTPNGDGLNDLFYPVGDGLGIRKIVNFSIFDRWGELIFVKKNIQLNDMQAGWDGRFRGETLNPGVFVYMLELELLDGSPIVTTGDFTLLR